LIRTEHLTRRFHDLLAVDDVSLHVPRGEILGFLGPNGAGKSTTIRILTGFLPATSGHASVAGHDVATESLAARAQLGYLPENVPLPGDARVDEYLQFRARLKGLAAARRGAACDRALALCGLVPMRRRIIGQLSRGYRQRVGLADALLADPPVLILDEPTGGLDPGQRQEVLDLVAGMRGERTVMLSSHVLSEVEHLCTRVAIITAGRILAQGTRDELEASAGHRDEWELGPTSAPDGSRLAQLEQWLAARGLSSRRAPDAPRCIVRLPSESEASALLAAAVRDGLPLGSFRPLTRSLHDIFLDLTRSGAA
jgi:ABC-2 type transport system ATP-binding protein